ncbi:MAG: T9SS type A sorting domain-containing protein [Aureispira sp.]
MRSLFVYTILMLGTLVVEAQQNCPVFGFNRALHTNHQEVNFTSDGTMFFDDTYNSIHHVPYAPNERPIGTVFAAAPWLSARDQGGNLAVMAPMYLSRSSGYNHGPIDISLGVPVATNCQDFNHIWRVSRWAVERLITDFNDNGVIDNVVEPELLQWPGKGNPFFAAQMGYPLPNQDLAPFYDQNNDGIYNPMDGDYPVYKAGVATAIAEQVLWNVFHSGVDTSGIMSAFDMKLEVQQTIYALDCGNNDILNKTFFVHHRVINRAPIAHTDVYYGNWNDFDLGCSADDYVGSIPSKNTVYAYNADNNDDVWCGSNGVIRGYGTNPPVQAVTFLNQTMNSAIYHINNSADPTGDPSSSIGFERLLSGVFPNGTPMTPSGSGYNPTDTTTPPTKFMFPNNPNNPTAWSMATASLSGLDQRTLGSLYKPTLVAGEIWDIELAYSYHRDTNLVYWAMVDLMERQVDSIQQYYDNGLHTITCPVVNNCVANCVYPGDANNNGIANDFDILEMGLYYTQTAAPRALAGNRWYPYNPPTPINNAYVDADGFGQVDTFDLAANTQNWGLTHSLYTGASEGSNAVGGDLYLERKPVFPIVPLPDVLAGGQSFRLDVYLGDSANVLNMQGVTYRLRYDPDVLEYRNVFYTGGVGRGGWLSDDGATIYYREIQERGLIHFVTTRLDNGNYSGQGLMDMLDFRVLPDASVGTDTFYTQICFEEYKAVQATGRVLPLTSSCITIAYADEFLSIPAIPAPAPTVYLYPNPAREQIQIDLGTARAEQIEVLDILGQPVKVYQDIQGVHTISRGHLPKGMYLVRVSFENGSQSTHKIIFQ